MERLLEITSVKHSDFNNGIRQFISSSEKITVKYKVHNHIKPFNLILSTSDIYYRENFHSDILVAILQKNTKYIHWFIDFINLSTHRIVDSSYYKNVVVVREDNRIDILIKDTETKHCIIFENKINNAGDMDRQIPRYVNLQKDNEMIIDAVVYFSLDGRKRPDTVSWTKSDKELMKNENIIYCAAVNDTEKCFLNNFLRKCILSNTSIDEYSFFRQYADLIQYMWSDQMDMNLMEDFYQTICKENNYKSAQSIRSMVNDLVTFRRDRIYNFYVNNHSPFDNISTWSSNDTLFHKISTITDENIKFDIFSSETNTLIQFWVQNPKTNDDYILKILKEIGKEKDFIRKSDNEYIKEFKFPEEDVLLYAYITEFCSAINNHINALKMK